MNLFLFDRLLRNYLKDFLFSNILCWELPCISHDNNLNDKSYLRLAQWTVSTDNGEISVSLELTSFANLELKIND